jgi:serine/threonine protein kinase
MIKTGKAGQGTYGVVYTAKPAQNQGVEVPPLAIKRNLVDLSCNFTGSIKELDMLAKVKGHPYIVDLMQVSFGNPFVNGALSPREQYRDDKIHFVFEQANLDGHKMIHTRKDNPWWSIHAIKRFTVQLLLGVEYMHAKGIIHRDIKPANTLIFGNPNNPTIKLCDFGLSKPYTLQGPQTPRVITSWYRAPEVCLNNYYDYKADMWSLGCTLFEMYSRKPFIRTQDNNMEIINAILSVIPYRVDPKVITRMFSQSGQQIGMPNMSKSGKKTMDQLLGFSVQSRIEMNRSPGSYEELLPLLLGLLSFDPNSRLTATQALNLPFFDGYRQHIEQVRAQFAPQPNPLPTLSVVDCNERKWACQVAFMLFNNRNVLPWYRHRVIFQAIDLFDRYLEWARVNNKFNTKIVETKTVGRLHTSQETEARFLVCLYIAIKYFTTMETMMSYHDLATAPYKTREALLVAEEFETLMIKEVCQPFGCIYRETVLESADAFGDKLDEHNIRDLLMVYGMMTGYQGITVRHLYNLYRLSRSNDKTQKGNIPSTVQKVINQLRKVV